MTYKFIRDEVDLDIPASVILHEDMDYVGQGHERQNLHLMLPADSKDESLPLVIYIHGGAWSHGTKDLQLEHLLPFVESGNFAVAAINYRFTDEGTWPMQLDDCVLALEYLRRRADDFDLDKQAFGLWGSSSGAHLAAMLALHNHQTLKCVVNYCGPSHFVPILEDESMKSHGYADSPLGKLVGGDVWDYPEKIYELSPVCRVHDCAPPMLLVHGTHDEAVPYGQSVDLHEAYKKNDCESILISLEGYGHKFVHDELAPLVARFFNNHLRGRKSPLTDQILR